MCDKVRHTLIMKRTASGALAGLATRRASWRPETFQEERFELQVGRLGCCPGRKFPVRSENDLLRARTAQSGQILANCDAGLLRKTSLEIIERPLLRSTASPNRKSSCCGEGRGIHMTVLAAELRLHRCRCAQKLEPHGL